MQGGNNRPVTGSDRRFGIPVAYIVVAVLIPLVIYFGYSAAQKGFEVYRLNQEADKIRAETDALKAENEQLRTQIEYLSSDAYVEKAARENLGLIKPGDKAVIVLGAEGKPDSSGGAKTSDETVDEAPNWLKWWDFFFGDRS